MWTHAAPVVGGVREGRRNAYLRRCAPPGARAVQTRPRTAWHPVLKQPHRMGQGSAAPVTRPAITVKACAARRWRGGSVVPGTPAMLSAGTWLRTLEAHKSEDPLFTCVYNLCMGLWDHRVAGVGARAGLSLKGRGAIGEIRERSQSGHRGCEAVGGRLLAVGNAVGGWCWGMGMPLG